MAFAWIPLVSLALSPVALASPGDDVRVNSCNSTYEQAETAIRVDPLDPSHLVAAAIDWSGAKQSIAWYTSFDGGATWSCGVMLPHAGYAASADPVVVFDAAGGAHLIVLNAFGPGSNLIEMHHSPDGGITFPTASVISRQDGDDKPQSAVCLAPGPNHGDLAVIWQRGFFPLGTDGRIFVSVSHDAGQTWSKPLRINSANAGGNVAGSAADVAYGPNGELHAMWVDNDRDEIVFDTSADGGVTWGADRVITSYADLPYPLPGFQFDHHPIFGIAVDATGGPYSGFIYVLFHTWVSSVPQHADVLCLSSGDGGTTWTSTLLSAGDTAPTDQLLPEIAVDAQGGVAAIWLDRRSDPGGSTFELWGGRSLDGGATFSELPLSDLPFDPANGGFGGAFIGHYNGVDAASSHAFACWGDSRAGSDFQDVWLDPWQLDLASDAGSLSAATGGVANLAIEPGPNLGGATYLLLGSASGTDPGLDFDDVHLPLVWDAFTTGTLVLANGPNFQNTLGTLGTDGTAVATLDTLGPFDPALAGTVLHFAALFFDPVTGQIVHATSAVAISLVP